MDPIKIDAGYISGEVLGEPGKEVTVYRGIPYAAPPVGDRRWKPPQPVPPWSGIRECSVFSESAPQPPGMDPTTLRMPQSEDCLYLNVLTPATKPTDSLPVMVWMHGGGFTMGAGNDPLYNAPVLPGYGVVVVTVNMRLGALGLLAHPLLSQESPDGVSGNYLFLDMIAALQWVQRNIAAFGGDPKKVTIFGESGGGAKVANLMASPLARGLFHQAICESGAATQPLAPGLPLKDMEAIGEKLFDKLGVDEGKDPLAAARALSSEELIEADVALTKELGSELGPWDSAVDGWFMPDTPADIFQAGKQNVVPLIVGANLGELASPGAIVMPWIIPAYVNMLSSTSQANVKVYAYIFDQVPAGWKQEGCVSCHAMELGYVFGDWNNASGFWPGLMGITGPAGAKSPDPGLTDVDRKVSDAMTAMWTQFAKTGNPSVEGLVTWPAWEVATDQYLYIADPLELKSGFSKVAQKE
jgi:para-nitrobenzyl esterase